MAEIRYLGVFFAPGAGLPPTCGKVMQKMRAAWALLRRRYERLDCAQSVWLQLQLCRASVVSAGSFASELWGVYPFGDQAQRKACKAVAALHLRVVKRIAGLRVTTSTDVVYWELELLPLQHEWLVSAARFFNTLRSGTGLHASLLRDCIQLAREGGCCWLLGLKRGLQAVGYQFNLEVALVPAIDLPCSAARFRLAWRWFGRVCLPVRGRPLLLESRTAPICGIVRARQAAARLSSLFLSALGWSGSSCASAPAAMGFPLMQVVCPLFPGRRGCVHYVLAAWVMRCIWCSSARPCRTCAPSSRGSSKASAPFPSLCGRSPWGKWLCLWTSACAVPCRLELFFRSRGFPGIQILVCCWTTISRLAGTL